MLFSGIWCDTRCDTFCLAFFIKQKNHRQAVAFSVNCVYT
nr:MAG TPA: hypothetical protein [Caudoviricetes sp.]